MYDLSKGSDKLVAAERSHVAGMDNHVSKCLSVPTSTLFASGLRSHVERMLRSFALDSGVRPEATIRRVSYPRYSKRYTRRLTDVPHHTGFLGWS
jgi:hypothetical protein